MDIKDLMAITGKSRDQVEAMLESDKPLSLNLTEKKSKDKKKIENEDQGELGV